MEFPQSLIFFRDNMKNHSKIILLLLIGIVGFTHVYRQSSQNAVQMARTRLLATLDASKVKTTATRTSNSQKFCTKARTQLVTSTDIETTNGYFNTLKMYFNVDPIGLVKSVIRLDLASLQTAGQNAMGGVIVYIAPFIIGLFLSLSLWTCLCCCCSCPGCCPSKCCQHDENIEYTKCEMYWPVIFLIVTLLLACAASIPGITRASTVTDSIQTMQCGVAISLDDILNGNISSSKETFFLGTNTMVSRLTDLQGNIINIINNLTGNLSSDVSNMKNNYSNAKTHLDMLPNGSNANTTFTLNYNQPLLTTSTTYPSGFGAVLGTASNSSTLTGILFQIVDGLGTAMTAVDSALTTLNNAKPTISQSLSDTTNTVSNYSKMISDIDVMLGATFSMVEPLIPNIKLAFLGFYGAVLGLSVLALIGVTVMACFSKPGCRYLMYFSCVFITLITILGSLLSFILSILVPILFLSCSVINSGIDTMTNFNSMGSNLGLDPNITGLVSVCLPGGDGKILKKMGSVATTINANIDNIMTTMNTSSSYGNYDLTNLTNALSNITNAFTQYKQAQRNDIIYQSSTLDLFKSIANRTKYNTCTGGNFASDSLVPNTAALAVADIPCSIATVQASCNSFATCGQGCLNMYSIFVGYDGAGGATQLGTDLNTRYAGASCVTDVTNDIKQMYSNWHKVRVDSSNGITSVQSRYNSTVKTDINNIISTMTNLKPKMTSTFNSLNSTLNPLLDPTYGLIAGINCLLMGEDIVLTKNTLCVSMFNSFYFLFMTIGTATIALLFSMCCITCAGVRHYKQNQKEKAKALGGQSITYFNNGNAPQGKY